MAQRKKEQTVYEPTTNKGAEVRTPNSVTRFHEPNDRVDFEREKYEEAKQNRTIQMLRVVLPGPRDR